MKYNLDKKREIMENINEIKAELLKKYKELRDILYKEYKAKQAYKIDENKSPLFFGKIMKNFVEKKDEINRDILDLERILNIDKIINNNEKGDEEWQVDPQN